MSLGALIALSLALGVAAWLLFVWSVRSGQYEDPEGPKYRMMDDDEGERAPRPKSGANEDRETRGGASTTAKGDRGPRGD